MPTKSFGRFAGLVFLTFLILYPLSKNAKAELSRDEALSVKAETQRALQTDSNNSDLWLRLGLADRSLGDLDSAQADFEKAAFLNPKNADAFYMLGLIYEKKKMTDQALSAWRSVLANSQDASKREVAEKHIHHLSR